MAKCSDYFKKSTGKWYTECFIFVDGLKHGFEGFDYASKLLKTESPGLSSRWSDSFDCLVTVHGDCGPQQMLVKE